MVYEHGAHEARVWDEGVDLLTGTRTRSVSETLNPKNPEPPTPNPKPQTLEMFLFVAFSFFSAKRLNPAVSS